MVNRTRSPAKNRTIWRENKKVRKAKVSPTSTSKSRIDGYLSQMVGYVLYVVTLLPSPGLPFPSLDIPRLICASLALPDSQRLCRMAGRGSDVSPHPILLRTRQADFGGIPLSFAPTSFIAWRRFAVAVAVFSLVGGTSSHSSPTPCLLTSLARVHPPRGRQRIAPITWLHLMLISAILLQSPES